MDKQTVLRLIVAQIAGDLEALMAAARATHAEATHEQNKPENKYDTRALEASYLAQGQGRQIAELEKAQQEFAALSLVDPLPATAVELGALLELKHGRTATVYLVGPRAGGTEVVVDGTTITVITPQSPIGRQLLGKTSGDSIVLPNDPERRSCKIARVW